MVPLPHSDLGDLARLLALSGLPLTKPRRRGKRREYSPTGSPGLGPNQTTGIWIVAPTLWTEKNMSSSCILHSGSVGHFPQQFITPGARKTFGRVYTGKHEDLVFESSAPSF